MSPDELMTATRSAAILVRDSQDRLEAAEARLAEARATLDLSERALQTRFREMHEAVWESIR